MTNEKLYQNTSDASVATLEEHKSYTPDEEWMEAGFASVDTYFQYLINEGVIVEVEQ